MAQQQEVKIVFKIEGLEGYISDLETLNQVLDKVQTNTKDAKQETEKLERSTKDAGDETGFLGERFNDLGNIFGKLKADFNLLTSGVSKFFTTGTAGAKIFKVALASTGIPLIIIAVATLIEYFRNTEKGAKTLQVIMTAFGVVVNKLIGFVADLGPKILAVFQDPQEALKNFGTLLKQFVLDRVNSLIGGLGKMGEALKLLFQGEFGASIDAAKQGLTLLADSIPVVALVTDGWEALSDEINDAVDSSNKYVTAQKDLEKLTNRLVKENAKLNQELEVNQRIAEDTTLSYEERKAALDKVNAANIQLAENEKKLADQTVKTLQAELDVTSSAEERARIAGELAAAQAEAINKETQLTLKKQEAGKIARELDLEELDRKQSIKGILDELRDQTVVDEEAAALLALQRAEETAMAELDRLRATDEEKKELQDLFDKRELKIKEEFEEKKRLKEQEQANKELNIISQLEESKLDEKTRARNRELADIQKFYDDLIKEAGDNATLISQINEQKNNAVKAANDRFRAEDVEADRQAQQSKVQAILGIAGAGIDALIALNEAAAGASEEEQKKAFRRNKALQIAQAGINTAQAVLSALANTPLPPPGPQIAAGIAAAIGVAQIAKISQTQFNPDSSTPPSTSSGPTIIGSPSSINPSNVLNSRNPNLKPQFGQEAGESIVLGSGSRTPVVRAYVVSTELTSQQNADARLEQLARL